MSFKYVGKSFEKVDGYAKVTGMAQYVADIKLPRTLHAQVLRPQHAHAKILAIDTAEAEKSAGVFRVVTGQDCDMLFGACGFHDQHPIARNKVRHAGEPVAVVIADSRKNAQKALKGIKIDYEPLEVLLDPEAALGPGAGAGSPIPCPPRPGRAGSRTASGGTSIASRIRRQSPSPTAGYTGDAHDRYPEPTTPLRRGA